MHSYQDVEINQLIIMAQNDDNAAFSELLSRYMPMINRVISGFSGSKLRYDEAFSEACVALHRAVKSYDISRSSDITFGLYARICVYRRICDAVDKISKELPVLDVDVDLIGTGGNIEQSLVGRERMAEYLSLARDVLSEYEYSVFLLYIDGYSTKEISEQLKKDNKSVENAKSRIFKRLRGLHSRFSDI